MFRARGPRAPSQVCVACNCYVSYRKHTFFATKQAPATSLQHGNSDPCNRPGTRSTSQTLATSQILPRERSWFLLNVTNLAPDT